MQVSGYRDILKRHFAERAEENPRYSLRAFARDLAISPSRLSEILNGKQGLSIRWAERIAASLALNAEEKSDFCRMVLASDARAKRVRLEAQHQLRGRELSATEFHALQFDAFKAISDWHHFALLELTKLKNFRSQPAWIARKLGISEYEAKLAIERLQRLELLEEKDGTLRATDRSLTTTHGVPSEAIRKFNKQILEKSKEAISTQTVQERDISSLTVAVRREDIPLVIDRIRKFRRELNAELERSVPAGQADEVYGLAIQFFRLNAKEPE